MNAKYKKYASKYHKLECATFIGPFAEGLDVMNALHDDGWRIMRSGPYTDKKMFPKMDVTRFYFVAQREMPTRPKKAERPAMAKAVHDEP